MARIVVAEDDPQMLLVIVETLRADGHAVDYVRDGERLLMKLARHTDPQPVDLIVSDIRMPRCTGLELVVALRARGLAIPVVLMTAFGDDETRSRAERLGVLLLDKPFTLAELSTAVARLVPTAGAGT